MANANPSGSRRLDSVDVLRGVVMILMALDHTRDYFGASGINPTDLATTTVPLFFTRWITHLCAPTFFLLTGTGAYLGQRRRGKSGLSRFLVTRGLWMIALELVILRCLAWQFNFDFRVTFLVVLWALGWAMITLSVLVRWSPGVAGVFGVILIAGHNMLDGIRPAAFGAAAPLWLILHQPGLLHGPPHFVLVAYPLIPWVGVTAVGYALGQVYDWGVERRRAFLLRLGAGLASGFVALRLLNLYGDPSRWSHQRSAVFTLLSFLNVTKYPPSLLFLLMTLGLALLFLWAVDASVPRWLRPAVPFGRVPLFYFVLHVIVIHVLALVVMWFRFGAIHWVFESPAPDMYPFHQPTGWPLQLGWVYAIWIAVVTALWPLCRWYASLRARHADWWWLSYL
ncbi:MAG: DUF1624 domain-containing protein [Gemmatimonadaceae bacterium]